MKPDQAPALGATAVSSLQSVPDSPSHDLVSKKLTKAHEKMRNITKKLHKRERAIEELKEEISDLAEKNVQLEEKCCHLQESLSFQETLSRRLQKMQRKRENAGRMVRYYREKATGAQSLGISEERNKLLSDLTRADQIISSLDCEISELAAELAREQIVTFEDGKYTDEMRQCCMSLLSHNVGVNNVGKVIVAVLQLANKEPCRLPSVTRE